MADKRKYAYYIKGNNVAIIQREDTVATQAGDSNDDYGMYKSPIESINDGLEIQYAHSPTYKEPQKKYSSTSDSERTYFAYSGWTAVDGYLTFVTGHEDVPAIWQWSDYAKLATDSHILIEGSNRWNGLHKIQEVQGWSGTTHAGIKTYTKVDEDIKYYTQTSSNLWSTGSVAGVYLGSTTETHAFWHLFQDVAHSDADISSTESLSTINQDLQSSYLWICGSAGSVNNVGLFTDWFVDASWGIKLKDTANYERNGKRYAIDSNGLEVYTPALDIVGVSDSSTVHIYEAFLDPGFITADVEVMEDESFDIDLNRYQANAVVYYLKAKLSEDAGDMEKREFFLREFKRQLEKGNSAIKSGPHIIQGFKGMR